MEYQVEAHRRFPVVTEFPFGIQSVITAIQLSIAAEQSVIATFPPYLPQ